MTEDQERRAADAAMLPILASLSPAGVLEAHWLPDTAGTPVVWIRTATEAGRVAVESYAWVRPQVQVILARLGLPPEGAGAPPGGHLGGGRGPVVRGVTRQARRMRIGPFAVGRADGGPA